MHLLREDREHGAERGPERGAELFLVLLAGFPLLLGFPGPLHAPHAAACVVELGSCELNLSAFPNRTNRPVVLNPVL